MHERDDDPAPAPPPDDAARERDAALAALQGARMARPDLPPPPADFDDRRLGGLDRTSRLLPEEPEKDIDLGTGWRRRLRDVAWRLLRPILERQQRFNTLLVEHLRGHAEGTIASRRSAAGVIAMLDRHLDALTVFQARLIDYVSHLNQSVHDLRHDLDRSVHDLDRSVHDLRHDLDQSVHDLRQPVHDLRHDLDRSVHDLRHDLDQSVHDLRHDLDQSVHDLRQSSRALEGTTDGLRQSLDALEETTEGLRQSVGIAAASARGLKREIERLHARPAASAVDAKADQGEAGRAEAGDGEARHGETSLDVRAPPLAAGPDLDAYQYVCFEDAFRGSPEEIAARQRAYLPYFEGAADVLDAGCGRGEFLALLREEGVSARGVDTNAEAVERCRERGLAADRTDALAYLRTLPDESIGGLFAAQVVEHLEADYLMRMLDEAHRTLRPGSRIVLETINPASWTAFFSAYVRDITHRHPLHPDTLGYLLRASGFVDVTVVYRAPVPEAAKLRRVPVDPALDAAPGGAAVRGLADTLNQHANLLNGLIFAEQDYAAIGMRPRSAPQNGAASLAEARTP